MFSFMKLATVAALAFGTFAFALPVQHDLRTLHARCDCDSPSGGSSSVSATAAVTAVATIGNTGELGVTTAASAAVTLTSILTDLKADLKIKIDLLSRLTADRCTSDIVNGIVVDIVVIVNAAVGKCNGLKAGALGSGNILVLLAAVIELVLVACGHVYELASDKAAIILCFAPIGDCLASLVSVSLGLIGGVLSVVIGMLLSLIGGCHPIILNLKLTALAKVLLL